MDPGFSDAEKRFVLAEMLKASSLDVLTLVDFVKSHNIEPEWLAMQVPNGRNLGQCIKVTEALFDQSLSYPSLKRKHPGTPVEIAPKRQLIEPHRSQQPPPPYQRTLHPRPSSNGYGAIPSPVISTPIPTGKKRGRPSKAEKAEKEAQQRTARQLNLAPHSSQRSPLSFHHGGYTPITPAPSTAIQPPLPSISTIQDFPAAPSPSPAYKCVPGSPDQVSLKSVPGRQSSSNPQPKPTLQETQPSNSNSQWNSGSPEVQNANLPSANAENPSEFSSQPRQMPSPVESRSMQLPPISESTEPPPRMTRQFSMAPE